MTSKYLPPQLRTRQKKSEIRKKAIIVPKIHNKYVLVKNRKSGDTTFIGGGCSFYSANRKKCALKELREETRNAINLNNLNNKKVSFQNKTRNPKEQRNNNRRGLNVTVNYWVYEPNISNKNFGAIKRKFHSYRGNNAKRLETSNIYLMSENNIKTAPKKYFIVNLVSKRIF
jgi:hypothetical protein